MTACRHAVHPKMERLSMDVERPSTEGGRTSRAEAKTAEAVALPATQMPPNCSHNAHSGSGAEEKQRLRELPSAHTEPMIRTALRECRRSESQAPAGVPRMRLSDPRESSAPSDSAESP